MGRTISLAEVLIYDLNYLNDSQLGIEPEVLQLYDNLSTRSTSLYYESKRRQRIHRSFLFETIIMFVYGCFPSVFWHFI